MNAKQLLAWIEGYYGEYRPVMRAEVARYLEQRSAKYLDALQLTLKRCHSAEYKMGPDIKRLIDLREETLTRMEIDKGLPDSVVEMQKAIEGPVEKRESGLDADPNIQKLREKWETDRKGKVEEPLDYHRAEPALPWLDGVRGDEDVSLSAEYYDDVSLEERMRRYCVKRKAVHGGRDVQYRQWKEEKRDTAG